MGETDCAALSGLASVAFISQGFRASLRSALLPWAVLPRTCGAYAGGGRLGSVRPCQKINQDEPGQQESIDYKRHEAFRLEIF